MTDSVSKNVAVYLVQNGVGQLGGSTKWCVSIGREPVSPAHAVTVYDTGGPEPDTEDLDQLFSFQVRVRGTDYDETYAKAQECVELLIEPAPISMAGHEYIACKMTSNVVDNGRDETDRFVFTANFLMEREND